MAFQISRCYHNRPGHAYTVLSWLDTLLPHRVTGPEGLRFRYPCLGQKDGGPWEDRSVWVEIGGWQMSNWTIRIRPRITLSSGLYSFESQDISQEGSSFKVDWDQEIVCVCVCHRDLAWERIWVLADAGRFGEDDGRTYYVCWSSEERYLRISLVAQTVCRHFHVRVCFL